MFHFDLKLFKTYLIHPQLSMFMAQTIFSIKRTLFLCMLGAEASEATTEIVKINDFLFRKNTPHRVIDSHPHELVVFTLIYIVSMFAVSISAAFTFTHIQGSIKSFCKERKKNEKQTEEMERVNFIFHFLHLVLLV